jgi:hypothetical protein
MNSLSFSPSDNSCFIKALGLGIIFHQFSSVPLAVGFKPSNVGLSENCWFYQMLAIETQISFMFFSSRM